MFFLSASCSFFSSLTGLNFSLSVQITALPVTDVMAAQTAWQKAQSQKIDAEIDVKLTQVGLNKALGILQ